MVTVLTSENKPVAETSAAVLEDQLARIAECSADALSALYHATRGAVYGLALSILKNPHDAEDVLHDCYVRVYSTAKTYRAEGKPLAWILTIARNLCYMKLREQKKTVGIAQDDWDAGLEFGEAVSPEDRLVLTGCMDRLTEQERQIVVLHAVAGFRHREIAQFLNVPLPTVLSKYSRALKKLRQYLERRTEG